MLDPQLNPAFSITFLAGTAILLTAEIIGVYRRGKGDTITEHWRWVNLTLNKRAPILGWAWRIFTGGMLTWTALHFLVGTS